ncbi:MAG: GPW/gp25 family protein [Stellaceae bacterium]
MSGSAVTLADIISADWSLMLDATAGGGTGAGIGHVVQGLADVGQAISVILGTMPGEDPWRPTFGCDLTQFIDRPMNAAMPAIVGTVTAALETWEPRLKVLNVTAQPVGASALGSLTVNVTWQIDLGGRQPAGGTIGALAPQVTSVTI